MTCVSSSRIRTFSFVILFVAFLTSLFLPRALAQDIRSMPTSPSRSGLSGLLTQAPPISFKPVVTYDSGGQGANSVAVADVNNDGRPDLIVGNDSGVTVLLGNGNGTFQAATSYGLNGNLATGVAVGDLNGDGYPDIAIASRYSESVFVLLNNGDGTFKNTVGYKSGGAFGTSVAIADLNGDGHADIIVTSLCQSLIASDCDLGIVGVLLGKGNGDFLPVTAYATSGFYAYSVAIADLNGDGIPDLAIANECVQYEKQCIISGPVSVMLGNGDGTLQDPVEYGTGGEFPCSVAIADFNGDGYPDLAVVNENDEVGILLGNGDGTFQSATSYASGGYGATSVAIGDLNGDGKMDLAVTSDFNNSVNYGVGTVGVLAGNGDGTFQSAVQFLTTEYVSDAIVIADVNGDGKPDMLVADYCETELNCNNLEGNVGVFLNNSTSSTSTTLTTSLNPSIYGQKVTFTATVTPTGSIPPTGKVTFSWSGYVLDTVALNSSGVATFTISDLNADAYPMVATYKGDANNLGSTSAIVTQVVNQTTSSATLTSSPNPSSVGQNVTFTAKITSPTVTAKGPVTFTVGKTVLGTMELNSGKATLTTSSLPSGSSTVTATYQGDSNIQGSSASVVQVVGESETSTTTNLAYSVNNSTLMETFTAEVTSSGGTPTGTVAFTVGNVTLGSAELESGQATLTVPTLSVGSNTVDANYEGNSEFAASSAWITQTFVMPVTGTLYLQQEGGSASATTSFGTGTSASNLVFYYSGLPNNPNPTGQVTLGTFTAGTLVNFGMYTTFGSQSGYAFSIGTDQASLVAFADLSNSLGMNHGVTQQTSSTTWLLHLDDALSYLYDDDNNDVLMELIVAPE